MDKKCELKKDLNNEQEPITVLDNPLVVQKILSEEKEDNNEILENNTEI